MQGTLFDRRIWDDYASLLGQRFRDKVTTTEDSVRYLFFHTITAHGVCHPNQVVLEHPYEGNELDTLIRMASGQNIAIEFKFHRGTGRPKTMMAGSLFADFFRLKRLKDDLGDVRCMSVYVTDPGMQTYFDNRDGVVGRWYKSDEEVFLTEKNLGSMAPTFLKYVGSITPCKLKKMEKHGVGDKHVLVATEIA